MCCILACFSARPSFTVLSNIMRSNKDGVGVAWLDRATGVTRWQKGLQTADAVRALTKSLPLPFVVHARYATAGGASPALTHPFPVEPKPSLALAGETSGRVLAHNGHVHAWADIAKRIGLQLPRNPHGWSDTRVLTALVARKGKGVLRAMHGQKFALLSIAGGLEIFGSFTECEPGVQASSFTGPPVVWDTAERPDRFDWEGWHQERELSQAARSRDSFDWLQREARWEAKLQERLDRIDAARARLNARMTDTVKGGK